MINRFLRGLPYSLVEPMGREYEGKCRDLQRWAVATRRASVWNFLAHEDTLHLIFSMGIYFRYVMAPLSSCTDFFERLQANEDVTLKIGGHEIDRRFQTSIRRATMSFHAVAARYGLSEAFFAESDVRRIVMKLMETERRRLDSSN